MSLNRNHPIRHALFLYKKTTQRVLLKGLEYRIRARKDIRCIRSLKNKYQGETIVLVCNGPSLKEIDFNQFEGVKKFFINKGYLLKDLYPNCGIDFIYTGDPILISDMPRDLHQVTQAEWHFCPFNYAHRFIPDPSLVRLPLSFGRGISLDSPEYGLSVDGSASVSLGLIHHLGFTNVGIIGLDHKWKSFEKAIEMKTMQEDDPDHFHKDYHKKGGTYQGPSPFLIEHSMAECNRFFVESGKKILNLTPNSECRSFPRQSLDVFLEETKRVGETVGGEAVNR